MVRQDCIISMAPPNVAFFFMTIKDTAGVLHTTASIQTVLVHPEDLK